MPIKKKKAVYSEKRLYELVALFPGEQTKRDEAKFVATIKKHLEDVGAEIQRLESWGERLLTYHIKGHGNACFVFSHFVLDSEQIAPLTKDLRLSPEVIRSLITVVPADYKLPETAELAKEFLGLNRQPLDPEEAEVVRESNEKRSNRRRSDNNQPQSAPAAPQTSSPAVAKPAAPKKPGAGLEQLDKKLDEILSK
ncbi:MAG: 30S ribosomal protein S6 [Candidatus Abawacabacteria bacterium]|nr:30S ribosomal protein S6 [Candidatus Abawacabacteria bacterium]